MAKKKAILVVAPSHFLACATCVRLKGSLRRRGRVYRGVTCLTTAGPRTCPSPMCSSRLRADL